MKRGWEYLQGWRREGYERGVEDGKLAGMEKGRDMKRAMEDIVFTGMEWTRI
jgi:flagellar biosynthesis/type III secretory pathway protein FliH